MNKLTLLFFMISFAIFAQVSYKGPAIGSVPEGHVFNTQTLKKISTDYFNNRNKFVLHKAPKIIKTPDPVSSLGDAGTNFVFDPLYQNQANLKKLTSEGESFINYSIEGPDINTDGRFLRIPPDCYVAAGPDHIVAHVNSLIFIKDKKSETILRVDPIDMFGFIENVAPFDPKITYDHFDNRWISTWLQVDDANSMSYYLIAVSDDADPNGIWYTWALPSNVDGDTPSGFWGDYQGVGYDKNAIYITSNNFKFSGDGYSVKLRILDKKNLYINSDPGQVTWTDIWDITYPSESFVIFGIRPVIMQTESTNYYLVAARPGDSNNSVGVYTLSNPLTNPKLRGSAVSTITYVNPDDVVVEQKGGSVYELESGGVVIRSEPNYTDGVLHFVHSAKFENKIGIRYCAISAATNSVISDLVMGTDHHNHLYPAIAVNGKDDVVITYSRVADDEYVGAFYTTIPSSLGTFTGSQLIAEGLDNYNIDFGTERNRWGDYMGAWVDPVDESTFWLFTQYAKRKDVWGTRLASVRIDPFANQFINVFEKELEYGLNLVDETTVLPVTISNYGVNDLFISELKTESGKFMLSAGQTLPLIVPSLDTLAINIQYTPTEHGEDIRDTIVVVSNAVNNPEIKIPAHGKGHEHVKAIKGRFYGATGIYPNGGLGTIFSIDELTGSSASVGKTGYRAVKGLTIDPNTNDIYAANKTGTNPTLIFKLRGNDAGVYIYGETDIDIQAMAFDNSGLLHAVTTDSSYYTIDVSDLKYSFVSKLPANISSICINPSTDELFAAGADDTNKDNLYKIDRSGNISFIGNTGLGFRLLAVGFGPNGDLFGSVGEENEKNKLVKINPVTAQAELIGDTNIRGLIGLAYAYDGITKSEREPGNTIQFVLQQNYPNPFNPTTTINYNLPASGYVKLSLFNSIGELIKIITNNEMEAGNHSVKLDNDITSVLSSGTYFYKLDYTDRKGLVHSQVKKMIFLK